jgi:hypothetical protein
MVTACALCSPAPFEAVLAVLASHASAVTPKTAARNAPEVVGAAAGRTPGLPTPRMAAAPLPALLPPG